MALILNEVTNFGESRELYVRLNSVESSNHGVESSFLFRGYLSKSAFNNNASYCWEKEVSFIADVNKPLWPQAYEELLKQYPEAISDLE